MLSTCKYIDMITVAPNHGYIQTIQHPINISGIVFSISLLVILVMTADGVLQVGGDNANVPGAIRPNSEHYSTNSCVTPTGTHDVCK